MSSAQNGRGTRSHTSDTEHAGCPSVGGGLQVRGNHVDEQRAVHRLHYVDTEVTADGKEGSALRLLCAGGQPRYIT